MRKGGKGADHATKEALRYRTALYQGFIKLEKKPLCTATAIEVCSTLTHSEMDIRKVPGTRGKIICASAVDDANDKRQ